ncbi:TetR/AcrR family transcriptional regulator [Streptomyces sp. CB03238]|uniref:TetR/AcrR family transcriptional regulator n=1 Tax=Streptomyces sp. CB03238 TaxID=1907777 RepID=UPI000A0FA5DC|nr:TetR/AcrR family transcriptional regulator [Streptomyces sp. CB03238]ORT58307.1 hypothetical protein BKD26_20675 [Streptomyces sp. CB03238]
MADREWLDEGLALLAEQGAPALTLDALCERVGKSKGAFYHHFGSMPTYRARLLEHWEAGCTTAIIDAVEDDGTLPAREKLRNLLARVVTDEGPDLEVAMRAWANQDRMAAAVHERVDATRIAYLRRLCGDAGHPAPDRMATLLYTVLIGGAHLIPPLPPTAKHETYELLLPLLDQLPSGDRAGARTAAAEAGTRSTPS